MTQISALKEEIKDLQEGYQFCDRSERFDLNQKIDGKKNQLLDMEREEIIHPFDKEPRLVAALNSIKSAINTLKEIQAVSHTHMMGRCIDQLEQQADRVQAEIDNS